MNITLTFNEFVNRLPKTRFTEYFSFNYDINRKDFPKDGSLLFIDTINKEVIVNAKSEYSNDIKNAYWIYHYNE